MIYRYFLILLACASILYGIQVPNFIIQYEQRLDAHFNEVEQNLSGFQRIADQQHDGSLDALIEKHRQSQDTTFRLEADAIQDLQQRYEFFANEKNVMQTSLIRKVMHLAGQGRTDLIKDTFDQYSFSVPLNKTAILSGLTLVGIVLFGSEAIKLLFGWRKRRKRKQISS